MHRATEEFLNAVFFLADVVTRPTLANLLGGFDQPVSRQQFLRLEDAGLISRKKDDAGDWVIQLTAAGQLAAHGGRDPSMAWSQSWDGKWRFLLFDLPRDELKLRRKLHRWLRASHFGCLQQSVWVTPHPVDSLASQLESFSENPNAIVVMEGAPPEAFSGDPSGIVESAWDFEELNRRYRHYLDVTADARSLKKSPDGRSRECAAWLNAINLDPLLPGDLLPKAFLGKKAWDRRRRILSLPAQNAQ